MIVIWQVHFSAIKMPNRIRLSIKMSNYLATFPSPRSIPRPPCSKPVSHFNSFKRPCYQQFFSSSRPTTESKAKGERARGSSGFSRGHSPLEPSFLSLSPRLERETEPWLSPPQTLQCRFRLPRERDRPFPPACFNREVFEQFLEQNNIVRQILSSVVTILSQLRISTLSIGL